MTLRAPAAAFLGALALAAGAARAEPPRGDTAYRALVSRGKAYAEQVCLACHGRREYDASSDPAAPPLARFARIYDAPYSLQTKLTDIAESGHYRMPPTQPHADEVEALATYIGSLREGAERDRGHPRVEP